MMVVNVGYYSRFSPVLYDSRAVQYLLLVTISYFLMLMSCIGWGTVLYDDGQGSDGSYGSNKCC